MSSSDESNITEIPIRKKLKAGENTEMKIITNDVKDDEESKKAFIKAVNFKIYGQKIVNKNTEFNGSYNKARLNLSNLKLSCLTCQG